jgi:hypothetical protein
VQGTTTNQSVLRLLVAADCVHDRGMKTVMWLVGYLAIWYTKIAGPKGSSGVSGEEIQGLKDEMGLDLLCPGRIRRKKVAWRLGNSTWSLSSRDLTPCTSCTMPLARLLRQCPQVQFHMAEYCVSRYTGWRDAIGNDSWKLTVDGCFVRMAPTSNSRPLDCFMRSVEN